MNIRTGKKAWSPKWGCGPGSLWPFWFGWDQAEGVCVLEIPAPYYGDRLRRQFPPSSRPLKLSTRIAFVLYYFPSDEHTFYFFTCVFKFQFLKIIAWRRTMAAKFPPSTSFPLPLLFYLLIVTVFRCMSYFQEVTSKGIAHNIKVVWILNRWWANWCCRFGWSHANRDWIQPEKILVPPRFYWVESYVHNNCHKNHTEGYMMIHGKAKLSQNNVKL